MRPIKSEAPPGAKGMIIRSGRLGYSSIDSLGCACAVAALARAKTARVRKIVMNFMLCPPRRWRHWRGSACARIGCKPTYRAAPSEHPDHLHELVVAVIVGRQPRSLQHRLGLASRHV